MKALKPIRVIVALAVLTLVTLFFLGFGGGFGLLERVQLIPALLGCSSITLAMWCAVTLVAGRVYCSMVCPLGILQDVLARVLRVFGRRRHTFRADRPVLRYSILAILLLIAALGGSALMGLVDPYGLFGRMATHLLLPPAEAVNDLLAEALGTEGPVVLFKREAAVRSLSGFTVAGCSLILLAGLVAWRGRVFCNTVCPAGALLSLFARQPVVHLTIDPARCVKCGACAAVCKAGCLDAKAGSVDEARCVRCFNCLGACAKGAISLGPVRGGSGEASPVVQKAKSSHGAGRRAVLAGLGAVAGSLALRRVAPGAEAKPGFVPPPGATLAELRAKCVTCGLCVARCPTHVLTPSGITEAGPLGFLLPRMEYANGFCRPDCTACGEACPSGAIPLLTREAKRSVKIAKVEWQAETCLICTEKIPCGLCARRCPNGALTVTETGVSIETAKCTGCGACAHYCPTKSFNCDRI